MAKVSIIIPIYGVENFIDRCARSLFEQTLDDIEYIFINDCTKDRSIEILNRIIKEYPKRQNQIRIDTMSTNSGSAAVRRHGIQLATSEYIIFCDSDDYIDNDMLEKMYNKALITNADIVMVDVYKEFRDKKLLVKAPYDKDKSKILSSFVRGYNIYQWNKLIKKTLYLEFISYLKKGYNMSEDYSIIVPLSFKAKKIEYVADTYYHYIQYNNNAITKKNKTIEEINGWLYSVDCLLSIFTTIDPSPFELDIIYRKAIIKYWCLMDSPKEIQKNYSHLYPELSKDWKKLIIQITGIKSKIKFYLIAKGYRTLFNLYTKIIHC